MRTAAAILVSFLVCTSCRYRELKEPMPFIHEVAVGEKVRVTLPENHINKESWNMLDDFDHAVLQHMSDVWHGNEKGLDVNLRCLREGSTQLTFIKRRYSDTVEVRKYLVTCKAEGNN